MRKREKYEIHMGASGTVKTRVEVLAGSCHACIARFEAGPAVAYVSTRENSRVVPARTRHGLGYAVLGPTAHGPAHIPLLIF